jgi:outer membrane protein assembly factor BamD (BamD/ComL family)
MTVVIVLAFSACAGGKAKELFETASFEEVQNNKQHARELYEGIATKYPNSEYAQKAKQRLSRLKQGGECHTIISV